MGMRLSAPWQCEYNRLVTLFEGDEDVQISELDETSHSCTVTMKTRSMAQVFEKYFRSNFLNVILDCLESPITFHSKEAALAHLFEHSPLFSRLVETGGDFSVDNAVFANRVVKVANDDVFAFDKSEGWAVEDLVRHFFGEGKIETESGCCKK